MGREGLGIPARSGKLAVMLYSCAMSVDLRIPEAGSLKAKRTVVKHVVEASRSRFAVRRQRPGTSTVAALRTGLRRVAGDHRHVEEVLDAVERFVWSEPAIEVVAVERWWTETG